MKPVLVLRHSDTVPIGTLGDALDVAGIARNEIDLHHGEALPPLEDHAALVVLGGDMGAYDDEIHPWLRDEQDAIRRAHALNMPMLGICLGAQLFAHALGGRAHLAADGPEIGVILPTLTDAGRRDPVLAEFDAAAVAFHQDTWEAPPGAVALARSDRYAHAFRLGSAVAIQAHPEASPQIVEGWARSKAGMLRGAGLDADSLGSAVAMAEPERREMAMRLFGAWIREIVGRTD